MELRHNYHHNIKNTKLFTEPRPIRILSGNIDLGFSKNNKIQNKGINFQNDTKRPKLR